MSLDTSKLHGGIYFGQNVLLISSSAIPLLMEVSSKVYLVLLRTR